MLAGQQRLRFWNSLPHGQWFWSQHTLLTAYNPESGTITYVYDADGELLQKTSPRANQTGSATTTISFCYDELHRMKGKADSAQACPLTTPVVTYAYDAGTNGIGHMTSLTDQAGSGSYSFDVLGRTSSEQRTIASVSKTLSYDYNLDGSVKTVHYPSGAAVTYALDSAGRDVSAIDTGNAISYVTGATYGADSAITGFISGNTGSFAGINNTFSYNKRLQPINMSASAPGQTVFSIGYDFHLGNGNNGNVWGITNYKDNSRNQSFTYDALNRLTSAQNSGTDCSAMVLQGKTKFWGNSYGYDAWGNLLAKTVTKCGAENLSLTALANNQLSGYSYDAAGNMTHDATSGLNYSYDQENRITGAGGYTYSYDSDGNRVEKSNGSTGTLYWYMTPGIVGESDLTGTMKSEYVFFDGERVARRDLVAPIGVFYYFSDHLKTASVITDSAGVIKSESDYYPWGGELQFTANGSNHYKFTGKERDTESGLDYFGARYYSNGLGRFITPDWSVVPVPVPYADLDDPQSLNQYSYVRNIPTSKADLDGHDCPTCPPPTLPTPTAEDVKLINEAGERALAEEAAAGEAGGMGALGTLGPGVLGGVLLEQSLEYYAETENIKSKTLLDEIAAANRIKQVAQLVAQQRAAEQKQEEEQKEHTRRRGSKRKTKDDHERKRPGTSPPPNYKPFRKHEQPKDDKKKDKTKPPYRRKDRDPEPAPNKQPQP